MVILIAPAPLCPSSCLAKKLLSEVASSVCLTKQYGCQDPRPRNLNVIVMLKTSDLLARGKMPQGGGILPRLPEVCSKCHVKFRGSVRDTKTRLCLRRAMSPGVSCRGSFGPYQGFHRPSFYFHRLQSESSGYILSPFDRW